MSSMSTSSTSQQSFSSSSLMSVPASNTTPRINNQPRVAFENTNHSIVIHNWIQRDRKISVLLKQNNLLCRLIDNTTQDIISETNLSNVIDFNNTPLSRQIVALQYHFISPILNANGNGFSFELSESFYEQHKWTLSPEKEVRLIRVDENLIWEMSDNALKTTRWLPADFNKDIPLEDRIQYLQNVSEESGTSLFNNAKRRNAPLKLNSDHPLVEMTPSGAAVSCEFYYTNGPVKLFKRGEELLWLECNSQERTKRFIPIDLTKDLSKEALDEWISDFQIDKFEISDIKPIDLTKGLSDEELITWFQCYSKEGGGIDVDKFFANRPSGPALSLKKKSARSQFDKNVIIDRDNWALTLISTNTTTGHAAIGIEGMDRGNYWIKFPHFNDGGIHFSKNLQASDAVKKTQTWLRARRKVDNLIRLIEEEIVLYKAKPKDLILFSYFGGKLENAQKYSCKTGVKGKWVVDNYTEWEENRILKLQLHNCITWAQHKLNLANIYLNILNDGHTARFVHFFAAVPNACMDTSQRNEGLLAGSAYKNTPVFSFDDFDCLDIGNRERALIEVETELGSEEIAIDLVDETQRCFIQTRVGSFPWAIALNPYGKIATPLRSILPKRVIIPIEVYGGSKKSLHRFDITVCILRQINNKLRARSVNLSNIQINDRMAFILSKNTSFTSLNLSNNQIRDNGVSELAKNAAITSLNLSNNQIEDQGVRDLAKNAAITSLNLSHNQIHDWGAITLSNTSITSLDLSHNELNFPAKTLGISEYFLNGVENFVSNRTITSLSLAYNRIEAQAAIELSKNTTLKSLDIGDNLTFDDYVAIAFSKNSTLTFLNLRGNGYVDERGDLIGSRITNLGVKWLAQHKNIISLDLGYHKISNLGAECIAHNRTLTSVNLSYNSIDDIGAAELAKSPSITSLFLRGNKIGYINHKRDMVSSKTIDAFAKNTTLTLLDLSANQIGDYEAMILSYNRTLPSLYLAENEISDVGVIFLAKNKTLTLLDLKTNLISEVGVKTLTSNRTLTSLKIMGNKECNSYNSPHYRLIENSVVRNRIYVRLWQIVAFILSFSRANQNNLLKKNAIHSLLSKNRYIAPILKTPFYEDISAGYLDPRLTLSID